MQDKLNLTVKDSFLADMQLEKLKKLLEQFGVDAVYEKRKLLSVYPVCNVTLDFHRVQNGNIRVAVIVAC